LTERKKKDCDAREKKKRKIREKIIEKMAYHDCSSMF